MTCPLIHRSSGNHYAHLFWRVVFPLSHNSLSVIQLPPALRAVKRCDSQTCVIQPKPSGLRPFSHLVPPKWQGIRTLHCYSETVFCVYNHGECRTWTYDLMFLVTYALPTELFSQNSLRCAVSIPSRSFEPRNRTHRYRHIQSLNLQYPSKTVYLPFDITQFSMTLALLPLDVQLSVKDLNLTYLPLR